MDQQFAQDFARGWAEAWNNKDLEAIVSHFSDDVVFISPVTAKVRPETGGVIRGKDQLRMYWGEGLKRIPDLHFEVEAVYAGVQALVINYRNHTGALVCEVLDFGDGELVARGHGTYLTDDAAGVSGVQPDE